MVLHHRDENRCVVCQNTFVSAVMNTVVPLACHQR